MNATIDVNCYKIIFLFKAVNICFLLISRTFAYHEHEHDHEYEQKQDHGYERDSCS